MTILNNVFVKMQNFIYLFNQIRIDQSLIGGKVSCNVFFFFNHFININILVLV